MERLKLAAIASLFLVAILAGGAAIRLVITAGDLRAAAATLGFVVILIAGAIFGGAKGPRWRQNPYW